VQHQTAEPWFLKQSSEMVSFLVGKWKLEAATSQESSCLTQQNAIFVSELSAARTNVHRRRQGELHHEHVAVERVVGQEPDSVRGMDHGDADQWQDHEAYADDRDDHRALEPRLPKTCARIQSSFSFRARPLSRSTR